jgi:uncharacterized membrane protein
MGFCPFGWGNSGSWGTLSVIGLILNVVIIAGVLALLVFGVRWIVRQFRPQSGAQGMETDALEIARRRLAAGEMNPTEFEEIRARLQR